MEPFGVPYVIALLEVFLTEKSERNSFNNGASRTP
jgi:hypothetical protein